MFASKTPLDLNHDPEPWVSESSQYRATDEFHQYMSVRMRRVPRREFDHVQNNAPNPILSDFRDMKGDPAMWLEVIESDEGAAFLAGTPKELGRITAEHIVHAHRVLRRLAGVS